MGEYHKLRLTKLDLGEGHRAVVCHECDRVLSVQVTENGVILMPTLKLIRQGNFFGMHQFSTGTPDTIESS